MNPWPRRYPNPPKTQTSLFPIRHLRQVRLNRIAAIALAVILTGPACSAPPSRDVPAPTDLTQRAAAPVPQEQPADAPTSASVQSPQMPAPASDQATVGSPPATESARDWLVTGDQAYARKDLQIAESAYRQACDLDPTLTPAYLGLALALRKQDRLEGSLLATEEALRQQPEYAEALANLGNLRFRMGQPDEAKSHLQRAIDLKPDLAEAHLTLGVVLHSTGDLQAGAEAYRRSAELDPAVALAHANLGIALDALDDNAGAIQAFRRAIEIDPNYAAAYNGLGKVLWQENQREESVQAMQQAVQIQPDFIMAHINLMVALMELSRFQEAWKHVHQAQALGAEIPAPLLLILAEELPDPRNPPAAQPTDTAEPESDGS